MTRTAKPDSGKSIEFRINAPEQDEGGKRPRPNLDYSSRAVKLRLFVLVCGVMVVLVLMFEARKPENWNWMGFSKGEPNIDTRYLVNLGQSGSDSQAAVDNRASKGNPPSIQSNSQTQTGHKEKNSKNSGSQQNDSSSAPNQQPDSPEYELAEKDFWDANYRKLNFRQRMLLLEGLYLANQGKKLDEQQASEWLRIAEEFSVSNDRYQADIVKYMTTLSESDPERGRLTETLFKLQNRWDRFQKVIQGIGNRDELSNMDSDSLGDLQLALDRTMLDFVEDNSLQSFVNDQPAMFRLIEKLQKGESWYKKAEPEKVLFAQLYKETERLRGKTVTFKGKIRGAYSARPAANYLAVDRLYVYWIQMDGAQNPVAVYSLKQPDGFVVNLDDKTGQDPAELREDVEITGVLFQKMVYAAEDGQRIAPVIFTEIPNWIPTQEKDPKDSELPGLTTLVATFLAIGGVLAVFTWGFVSLNNRKHAKKIAELKDRFDEAEGRLETETGVKDDA